MDRKWWSLIAVCTAIFMLLLDITIVNVALPAIEESLNADFSDLQWVVDAYALSLASLLLTAGSLADLFGRRKFFMGGLVIFTVSSIGCAVAGSPWQLIASRAVQGIGGAVMFSTSLAIIAHAFRGKSRGTAFGIFGATTGIAVAVGPTLGGALTTWASWSWIFLINVPIGIAAFLIAWRKVDESKQPHEGAIDWPGVTTFSIGLFALVLALIEGPDWGWGSTQTIGTFAAAAVLLLAFGVIESRVKHPMFDLSLLRNRTFLGASIVAFTLSASIFALFLFIVLYLQNVQNLTALQTGVRFLPLSGVSFIAAAISGRLTETVPRKYLMGIGMAVTAVSLPLIALVSAGDSWTVFIPGFVVAGIGIGLVNPALASTAVGVVEPQRSGMASGINSTFRQVGIATGIAALGAIFRGRVESGIVDRLQNVGGPIDAKAIAHGVASGAGGKPPAGTPQQVADTVRSAIEHAFVNGFHHILYISTGVAVAGMMAAWLLISERDIVQHG